MERIWSQSLRAERPVPRSVEDLLVGSFGYIAQRLRENFALVFDSCFASAAAPIPCALVILRCGGALLLDVVERGHQDLEQQLAGC